MATAIMKQKEVPEMDDVEEIISKISEDSPYKRRPTQKRVFKNSWKVRIVISWIHRMIMKNLHRNRILPWLISGGRNYHKPEYEEAMEI